MKKIGANIHILRNPATKNNNYIFISTALKRFLKPGGVLSYIVSDTCWKGIDNIIRNNFIKTAINANRKAKGLDDLPAKEMLQMIREKSDLLEMDRKFLSRSLNEGFSGGEKKKNEIFQMAMLDPKLAILDETDSGLDIDALRIVANGVNKLKQPGNSTIVITHYQRLLDYIVPDVVHVLYDGRIVKTAGRELALELEAKGYDWIKHEEIL